jgi:hypothetical protein
MGPKYLMVNFFKKKKLNCVKVMKKNIDQKNIYSIK